MVYLPRGIAAPAAAMRRSARIRPQSEIDATLGAFYIIAGARSPALAVDAIRHQQQEGDEPWRSIPGDANTSTRARIKIRSTITRCHCSVCKRVTTQATTHVVFFNYDDLKVDNMAGLKRVPFNDQNPKGPLELCLCAKCGKPIMLDDKQKRIRAIVPNLMGLRREESQSDLSRVLRREDGREEARRRPPRLRRAAPRLRLAERRSGLSSQRTPRPPQGVGFTSTDSAARRSARSSSRAAPARSTPPRRRPRARLRRPRSSRGRAHRRRTAAPRSARSPSPTPRVLSPSRSQRAPCRCEIRALQAARARAERRANTDLVRTLRDGVCHHAVDADRCEQ